MEVEQGDRLHRRARRNIYYALWMSERLTDFYIETTTTGNSETPYAAIITFDDQSKDAISIPFSTIDNAAEEAVAYFDAHYA